VAVPTHHGFGTRLFLQALEQFGGTIKTKFAESGLVCELTFLLPEIPPTNGPNLMAEGPRAFTSE
jgi:two-component sensor histidine kinase